MAGEEKKHEKVFSNKDNTVKLFAECDLKLNKTNKELDEKVREMKENEERMKEINDILEIRLLARTRQLRENVSNLDAEVKKRTKKIENSKKALLNILADFKEEKEKAENEKEKTFSIISNFSDGLLIFDSENILDAMNKKAEKFLEVKEKDVINKTPNELLEIETFKFLIDIIGVNVKNVFREEFLAPKNRIIEVSVDPISVKKKEIGKFVILHDITREKKVQKLKTEFVSIAAHQLRTPLSAIKWTLTSLLEEDLGKLNEKQRDYLEKTNLSNERMINLVDDLLNLSRIEEGRYVQKEDFFDVGKVAEEVIDSEEIKIRKKNVKINLFKEGKRFEVLADKEKIKLVIQNLIENSINYSLKKVILMFVFEKQITIIILNLVLKIQA